MADQKITQLTALASAASTDVLPIVDVANTETKKITKADLLNGLQAELVSGTNIKTINSTSLLGSGDIAISANPAGTDGQIQFSDGSAFAADSNLYWDNTNKRFGVGTNAPTSKLQIVTDDATNPQAFSNQTSILAGTASQGALISAFSSTNGAFLNALWPGNAWFKMNYGGTNHSFSVGGTVTAVIDSNTTFGNAATTLGARLGIKGSGSTSATTSLLVQNSSGTEMFRVQDDNKVSSSANIIDLRAQSYSLLGQSSSTIYCSTTYTALYSNPIILGAIATPNASSIVEISSTTKGFLPPRMTTTQKNAISSPAAGLQVYDSTTNRAAVYTSAWENVITETNGSPNSVYKLWSGSAAQYAALTPDSSTLYFVI